MITKTNIDLLDLYVIKSWLQKMVFLFNDQFSLV